MKFACGVGAGELRLQPEGELPIRSIFWRLVARSIGRSEVQLFRFPILLTLFAIIMLLSSLAAYSQAARHNISHIEVVVRPRRVRARDTAPLPRLRASNFELRQQGLPIAIHLAGSGTSYPRHLLIIVPALQPSCPQLGASRKLRNLIAKGWTIQIAYAEGAITLPIGSTGSSQATCGKASSVSGLMPIQYIEKEPGRRIILFTVPPSPDVLADAIHRIPEVFSVDGGVSVSSHTGLLAVPQPSPSAPPESETTYTVPCHTVGGRISPNDPCNLGVSTTYKKNGFSDGVMHEKSIAAALQDMLPSNRYYDLSFQLPSSPTVNTASFDFTIHYDGNLSLAVAMYSEINHSNNSSMLRNPVNSKLNITQRR